MRLTASTVIKYILTSLLALALGLFVGAVVTLYFLGLDSSVSTGEKAGAFVATYVLLPATYIGFFIFFAYALFRIRPANYKRHYTIVIVVTLALTVVAGLGFEYMTNRNSRLASLTGQEARSLFSENEHKYHTLPGTYPVKSRTYKNAITETLESVYFDKSDHRLTVKEWPTESANSLSCAGAAYPCEQFRSERWELTCFTTGLEASLCQFSPERGYLVSIEAGASIEATGKIADQLTAYPTRQIELVDED